MTKMQLALLRAENSCIVDYCTLQCCSGVQNAPQSLQSAWTSAFWQGHMLLGLYTMLMMMCSCYLELSSRQRADLTLEQLLLGW